MQRGPGASRRFYWSRVALVLQKWRSPNVLADGSGLWRLINTDLIRAHDLILLGFGRFAYRP